MVVVSSLDSFGMELGGGGGGAWVTVKLSAEPWRKASRVAFESFSGGFRSLLALPPKSLPMKRPLLELGSFSMLCDMAKWASLSDEWPSTMLPSYTKASS